MCLVPDVVTHTCGPSDWRLRQGPARLRLVQATWLKKTNKAIAKN